MRGTTVCRGTVAIAVVAALAGAAGCTSSDAFGDTDRGGRASGKVTAHPAVVTALRAAESSTDRADSARVRSTTTMGSDLGRAHMDMWVDGQDHTKQVRMRGDADKGPLDLTFTFLDFDKPVKVTAPPAKDTADLAEMMKGLQG